MKSPFPKESFKVVLTQDDGTYISSLGFSSRDQAFSFATASGRYFLIVTVYRVICAYPVWFWDRFLPDNPDFVFAYLTRGNTLWQQNKKTDSETR